MVGLVGKTAVKLLESQKSKYVHPNVKFRIVNKLPKLAEAHFGTVRFKNSPFAQKIEYYKPKPRLTGI